MRGRLLWRAAQDLSGFGNNKDATAKRGQAGADLPPGLALHRISIKYGTGLRIKLQGFVSASGKPSNHDL